ncbi:NADH-quinone oxidoreductase subunit L [Streptococcus sp. H49]|uniref:NADH-quinone oxidoreductase subunit L n=1 Tax=Streptococcus huangxiaojuni TaxID=3237239 RepID=UPI0034A0E261
MTIAWYYWLLFALSWLFAVVFWIKSSFMANKRIKIIFIICGFIAFFLPFFWGWLLS